MTFGERVAQWLGVKPEVKTVYLEHNVEKIVYKVVEVKDRPIQEWDKETKDAISTLPAHPGFLAVMNRLSLQRQMLNTKLSASYHKELREVDFLQSGLYWLNYIQNTVEQATKVRNAPKQLDAYDEEREAFERINAAIERVG